VCFFLFFFSVKRNTRWTGERRNVLVRGQSFTCCDRGANGHHRFASVPTTRPPIGPWPETGTRHVISRSLWRNPCSCQRLTPLGYTRDSDRSAAGPSRRGETLFRDRLHFGFGMGSMDGKGAVEGMGGMKRMQTVDAACSSLNAYGPSNLRPQHPTRWAVSRG